MQGFFSPERREKETLKKSTPEENAVNKLFSAVLREKLQKNLIKSMPEKNLVLYASPGENGRKKKVKIVQYPGRAGKGSFTSEFAKKMQSGCAKGHGEKGKSRFWDSGSGKRLA